MGDEEVDQKSAILAMTELSNMLSVPMSLNAVVRLNVPSSIYDSGRNAPLTAAQILRRLQPPPPPTADAANLQRLLRLLSSHGVFREHTGEGEGSQQERRYSLTEIGKTLVSTAGDGSGPSYAAYVLQHHQDAMVRAWSALHEAVLDPSAEPFARVHGMPAYEYYGKDAAANDIMQKAMWGVSIRFMEAFLDGYDGEKEFAGVETLVDVGGSSGKCLSMIMETFPTIRAGINFDLPEVVAAAHSFPGVTNVGGDMFKSIPPGDAIFMKWVITTWTDDEVVTILKNCYDALPAGGKAIACEPVLPEETDNSRRTRTLLAGDIFVMTTYRAKGRERTELEYQQLGELAGFPHFRAMKHLDHFFTVMQFQK